MKKSIALSSPQRLLLATDFSVRDDRALDRARQLAREWRSELSLVAMRDGLNAPSDLLEWADSAPAYSWETFLRKARKEFSGSNLEVSLRVAHGDTSLTVPRAAAALDSELIITAERPCSRIRDLFFGTAGERLLKKLSRPLLVVRNRVQSGYRRIVVATDLSAGARQVLEKALRLFPEHVIVLYHVQRQPYSGLTGSSNALRLGGDVMAREKCSRFLDGCKLPAGSRTRLRFVTEQHVSLVGGLDRFVRNHDVDLVVIGSTRRSALASALFHDDTESMLHWLSCDTLVVPKRKPDRARAWLED